MGEAKRKAEHTQPGLLKLIDELPEERKPALP